MNPFHTQGPSRVQGRTREQRSLLSPIAIETLNSSAMAIIFPVQLGTAVSSYPVYVHV